jgi:hypothetical protein
MDSSYTKRAINDNISNLDGSQIINNHDEFVTDFEDDIPVYESDSEHCKLR